MNLLKQLSNLLLMEEIVLVNFAKTAPYRYKSYEIPKKNGKGFREIAQPSKELKFIQQFLVRTIEHKLPVSEVATAYRTGSSIKRNATLHKKNQYLLKMDFKNFFPSITPNLFFSVCNALDIHFEEEDKFLLAHIFFRKKRNDSLRLSIGAPSSPLISNFVMHLFDVKMQEECSNRSIVYTRYADDLSFSTNEKDSLFELPSKVSSLLSEHTFGNVIINHSKTVFSSKKHNRHITGITITNDDNLSLGRDRKRKISSLIHKYSLGILDEEQISYTRGILSFAEQIEPEFITRMKNKYGEKLLIKLISNQ